MWVSIYLVEAPPLKEMCPLVFFPPPMPLTKALWPITFPQGPHFIVLTFLKSFFCVIMISALILSHPVNVSSTDGSTIPSLHVGTMSQARF